MSPSYQVYACGPFLVKRWDGTSYQPVPVGAWGGSHSPRLLLKVLLCSPGRQASRGRLLEILWPGIEQEEAARYLNDAAYRLRKVLQPPRGGESLLLTAKDTSNYTLAGQADLWVDADAALFLLEQVEVVERQGSDPLPLLEEAAALLSRGEFLEEEGHLSFHGRRATVARARRGCVLSQARAYGQRGWLLRGEALLSRLLEENVLDEDALRALMLNLHQQKRTWEGLRLYEETCALLAREGQVPTKATQAIEQQLRRELSIPQHSIDWGEAPHLEFYGREREQAALVSWVGECRLVVLVGMGGIGKTSLAVRFVDQVQQNFMYVFWRSLQHSPPLKSVLQDCLKFLTHQQHADFPSDVDYLIALIMQYLQTYRCLIVFDNLESIFRAETGASWYREGYEDYGRFFRRIGETRHRSCLLLTSRERPRELSRLEGDGIAIRTLRLEGVGVAEGQAILKDKGLLGSQKAWEELIQLYAGNPLALKLIAEPIRELFHSDIDEFLQGETTLLEDVHQLLDQQFQRLSEHERALMYWLAIEREAVSLETLWEDALGVSSKQDVVDALTSLRRRCLIETDSSGCFTLQPVIMEYVISEVIRQMYEEIYTGTICLLASHALIKAQTKEYLREMQVRLILTPLVERLLTELGRETVEKKLRGLLTLLHEEAPRSNYAAGNLLNLLVAMHCDLRDYDFSGLQVRQAFLQAQLGVSINFAHAELLNCVFTDTFGSVLSVALDPSGSLLAAGTTSNDIRLWHVSSGTPSLVLRGHTAWVRTVAFSPNGKLLASGGDDQTVRLWDAVSGDCLVTLSAHSAWVRAVAFSPDGKILASGGEDQTIHLWDVSSRIRLRTLQSAMGRVRAVAFSPDGKILASGGEDQTIHLWDVSNGNSLKLFRGHSRRVRTVAFSSDGTLLASGGDDQVVRLWDVASGDCLAVFQGHKDCVRSVAFRWEDGLLASGSEDQSIRLWDVKGRNCVNTLQGHTNWIWSVAFSPDGTTLVSGSEDQTVRLWDVASGRCLKTLQGYVNWAWSLDFSPDGTTLVSGSEDQTVRLWDVASGRCLKILQGHSSRVRATIFSSDSSLVASSSEDRTVRLWDESSGRCFRILQSYPYRMWSLAFSPDGTELVGGGEDLAIWVWDVRNEISPKTLGGHTDRIRAVAFSSDGRVIASGSEDQTVRLWNAETGSSLHVLRGHEGRIWAVAFDCDSNLIASGGDDQTVRVWEVNSGYHCMTLQGHTARVRAIAFSPNGRLLASGSEDYTVRLWETKTETCLQTLQGHSGRIRSIVFHPYSPLLASSSDDGTIKFWNTSTGICTKTLSMYKPYDGMNITGVRGLTEVQKGMLKVLGAFEEDL